MAKSLKIGSRQLYIPLIDFVFLLYVVTVTAFTRGEGIDSILSRGMFVILSASLLYQITLKNKWKMRVNYLFFGYVLFWGYYLLACLWGNAGDGLYYIQRLVQVIIISLFLANNIREPGDVDRYFKFIYLALLVFTIRLIIVTPLTSWGNVRVGEELNLKATHVGLMCTFGVLLSLYFSEKNKLNYLLFAYFMLIVFFSGTRTSILMISVGLLVYLFLKERGAKRIIWILVTVILMISMFFIIMKVPVFYNILGFRIDKVIFSLTGSTFGPGTGMSLRDYSAYERAYYREIAFKLFKEHPVIGCGANGFTTYMRQIGYIHETFSHCNYTELLATLGLVGFCIYYFIQLRTAVISFRYYHKTRDHLTLLVFALMASCLVGDYSTVSYLSVIIQIIMCLCGNLSNLENKELAKVSFRLTKN